MAVEHGHRGFPCDLQCLSHHILSPFTYSVICLLFHVLDVPDLQ